MNDNQFEPEIQPDILAPFAGRHDVFARIQQYLIDPSHRHALLIIGRDSMGKSRILQQCAYVLEDNVTVCYLPLSDAPLHNDEAWLRHIIHATNLALSGHDFTISRLPQFDNTSDEYRQWIDEVYLPELQKLIRSHRRLVWLIDDAEHLLDAINASTLPDDTLVFLHHLLQNHLQIGIVLTLSEDNEARTTELSPLVPAGLFQRLHPLSAQETAKLLVAYNLTVEQVAQDRVFALTDGHPLLVQSIGEALQAVRGETITRSHIDTITNQVYQKSHETFRYIWQNSLSQNERLVLTAISGLLYDNPLADLTTQRIESWLLETDHPRDMTAVNAGIRGLEYRDLIVGGVENIRIRSELFQRWLIEHARMNEVNPTVARSNANDDGLPLSRNSIIFLIAIAIAVVLVVAVMQQSNQTPSQVAQPTVTLEP